MFLALTTAGMLTVTAYRRAWATGPQSAFPTPADVIAFVRTHTGPPDGAGAGLETS